jgi:hypothetical protein
MVDSFRRLAVAALSILTLASVACTGEVITYDPSAMSAATDDEVAQDARLSDCAGSHAQGRRCDDGHFCTVNDRCDHGVCEGEPRACAAAAGFCATPVCDEDADTCTATVDATCTDPCSGAHATRAYQRGFRRGWKTVERSWERHVDDCDRTGAFVERVTERLTSAQESCDGDDDSRYRRCRVAGATAGSFAALDQIQASCDESCFLGGELVGDLAAKTYCELALDGNPPDGETWVRGPLNECGLNYEVACDSSFVGTSIDFENDAGQCRPFTEGDFADGWDRTREKSCDYQNRP